MKKNGFIILVLLLSLLLSGCAVVDGVKDFFNIGEEEKKEVPIEEMSDPDRSRAIFKQTDIKMDSLSSYTSESVMNMEVSILGIEATGNVTQYEEVQNAGGENLVHYIETVSEAKAANRTEKITQNEGFIDGRMYRSYDAPDLTYEIYSFITASEYETFLEEKAKSTAGGFDISNFSSCISEQTENGGWKLIICGANDSTSFDAFREMLDEDMLAEGVKFSDIQITMFVDANFYCQKMLFDIIYTGNEETSYDDIPKIHGEIVYSNFNSTEATVVEVTKSHKRVQDLRLVTKAEQAYDKFCEAESGSFVTKVYDSTSPEKKGELIETATANFSVQNGGLFYVVNAEINGVTSSASYSNGIITSTINGSSATAESDDETERDNINGLAFPVAIETDRVFLVEKGADDNSFVVHMKLSSTAKSKLFGSNASIVGDCFVKYTFTFNGDKIVQADALICYFTSTYKGTNYLERSGGYYTTICTEDIVY